MMKVSKVGKSIAAGVLAAAVALSGTFAWQSISQRAQNEMRRQVNPGGRLHDDYNGWEPGDTKDIYVENFGERAIFARVRLDEYMELGEDAGSKPSADKAAIPLIAGAKIDDPTTWQTHLPAADFPQNPQDPATDPFHAYWDWTMGGQAEDNPDGVTVYMPTFNMNKDSLSADINGSLKGNRFILDAEGNRIPFSDYVKYEEGDTAGHVRDWTLADESGMGDSNTNPADLKIPYGAFVDADDNTVDEANVTIPHPSYNDNTFKYDIYGNGGTAGTNYKVQEEQHVAKETGTAKVITMTQYKLLTEEQKKELNAWVYDADGWAYWSQPIEPGTATGLLLDRISLRNEPDESWYYAINAVGQFVTADDLGRKDNPKTGFYAVEEEEPSADAVDLLEFIGVDIASKDGISMKVTAKNFISNNTCTNVAASNRYYFTVMVTAPGATSITEKEAHIRLEGNTSTNTKLEVDRDRGPVLTVGADETVGNILTIVCESQKYPGVRERIYLPVGELTWTLRVSRVDGGSLDDMYAYDANGKGEYELVVVMINSDGVYYTGDYEWTMMNAIYPDGSEHESSGSYLTKKSKNVALLHIYSNHNGCTLSIVVRPTDPKYNGLLEKTVTIKVK